MSYRNRGEARFFVINLLEEVKTRELTTEETDKLMELFTEAYGYLPPNLCLHPQWLLNKWDYIEKEDAEIEEWYQQDVLSYMDNTPIELKQRDISFMCDKPLECQSHINHSFDCHCIRSTFKTPTEFKLWAENELTELKDELTELRPEEK
jgi:hypothetical protein